MAHGLFQVLVDCLGHLKHIQFFPAENRLQLVVGEDFTLVLRILEFVLLDMGPNLFRDLAARKRLCPDNFG